MKGLASHAATLVSDGATAVKQKFQSEEVLSKVAAKKEAAKVALLNVSAPVRQAMLSNLKEVAKQKATADPDMWRCVRPMVRSAVDGIWVDVEKEVERNLEQAMLAQENNDDADGPSSTICCCCLYIRACILHHYIPHDKSFFGKAKDPIWLLITAVILLPVFGVRVMMFSLILLLILFPGPPDEFQLVQFILRFKGSQCLTSGILGMCLASVQYFLCYSTEKTGGGTLLKCIEANGPGSVEYLWEELLDYIGSIALVWIAFCFLPCSETHSEDVSRVQTIHKDEDETYCCCLTGKRTRGGRLSKLLWYDVFTFTLSAVTLAAAIVGTCDTKKSIAELAEDPQLKACVFWCKVLYALLSFPFLLFVVPVLTTVLTHCDQTGYNEHGACVKFDLPANGLRDGEESDDESEGDTDDELQYM